MEPTKQTHRETRDRLRRISLELTALSCVASSDFESDILAARIAVDNALNAVVQKGDTPYTCPNCRGKKNEYDIKNGSVCGACAGTGMWP